MSRSFKKNPFGAVSSVRYGKQKKFTSKRWRALRNKVKATLRKGDDSTLPDRRVYYNEWQSPRDGKIRVIGKLAKIFRSIIKK